MRCPVCGAELVKTGYQDELVIGTAVLTTANSRKLLDEKQEPLPVMRSG